MNSQIPISQVLNLSGHKTVSGEYHIPCPFCGGTDRFVIFKDGLRALCRQCQFSGDAIALLMKMDGINYGEAVRRLGVQSRQPRQLRPAQSQSLPEPVPALENEEYRTKALAFAEWAYSQFCEYKEAQGYMAHRGFSRQSCDVAMIGYSPKEFHRVWGGVEVYIPAHSIVIPWIERESTEQPIKLRFRHLAPNSQHKYTQAKGGANGLYRGHRLFLDCIAVVTESELDALSVHQAVRFNKVVAVATGGTTGARLIQWQALLALPKHVLIAFDEDEAGEVAAKWWLDRLPNAIRLMPTRHDVNDMLRDGENIRAWIANAIPSPARTRKRAEPAPSAPSATQKSFLGQNVSSYDGGL